jgi:hypothetical protein
LGDENISYGPVISYDDANRVYAVLRYVNVLPIPVNIKEVVNCLLNDLEYFWDSANFVDLKL